MKLKLFYIVLFCFSMSFAQNDDFFEETITIISKLDSTKTAFQYKAWLDRTEHNIDDNIVLVVEANRNIELDYSLKIPEFTRGRFSSNSQIENGKEWNYYIFEFKPTKSGKFEIPSIKIKLDDKTYFTEKIEFIVKKE